MAKILIIDDEEPILNMYGEALGGHEVMYAVNGQEGLELAQKETPDIILLDIVMPKFNGLDVLDMLKNNKDTDTIPVIMLSNLPKEVSADRARELGAAGYFVKAEFEPDKIARAVNNLLREGELNPIY